MISFSFCRRCNRVLCGISLSQLRMLGMAALLWLLLAPLSLLSAAGGSSASIESTEADRNTLALLSGLPDFTRLVRRYGPAVVNISTQEFEDDQTQTPDSELDRLPVPFDDEKGLPWAPDHASLGSGFIISPDGYVLTNVHVVEEADEILVRTSDRREFLAELVGADEASDVALLKIEGVDLPVVRLAEQGELEVGEWVLAIGSPFGFEHSVTAGIVSAKGRSLPSENYVPFIQTDVAINPGNSGGPLFNLAGEVVGINSQIYSRDGGFMGLSFAIPIEIAMSVAQQLRETGRVRRGWLGVLIQDLSRDLAESFGLSHPHGALIAEIMPGSPAEAAGLRAGDIILSFNGESLPNSGKLPPLVGMAPVGSEAVLDVFRDRARYEIRLVLQELPRGTAVTRAPVSPEPRVNRLGLVLETLDAEQLQALGVNHGLLVDRVEPGPAQRAGLRAGDLLLSLDNQPVSSMRALKSLLAELPDGRPVAVLIQRGGGRVFYSLRLSEPLD